MSCKTLVAAAVLLALCTAGTASADRRSFGNSGTSNFTSNGKFGIGVELGAPTGFNGKLFLSPNRALDFGIGWLYDNYYRGRDFRGIHLYIDHLWHPVQFTENPTFKLPFYFGVGGAFWSFDDRNDRFSDHYSALAIRVPVGVAFDFNKIPLDLFAEVTFVVDIFLSDTYVNRESRFGPGFLGSVGARFWF